MMTIDMVTMLVLAEGVDGHEHEGNMYVVGNDTQHHNTTNSDIWCYSDGCISFNGQ